MKDENMLLRKSAHGSGRTGGMPKAKHQPSDVQPTGQLLPPIQGSALPSAQSADRADSARRGSPRKIRKAQGSNSSNDLVLAKGSALATVTFAEIAELYPSLRLAVVMLAEKHFQTVDSSRDGTLSTEEISEFFAAQGVYIEPEELPEIIAPFDTNGNGKLEYLEYLGLLSALENDVDLERCIESIAPSAAKLLVKLAAVCRQESKSKGCPIQ